MSIPGTGLSYQAYEGWAKDSAAAQSAAPPKRGSVAPFWIGATLLAASAYGCSQEPPKPTVTTTTYPIVDLTPATPPPSPMLSPKPPTIPGPADRYRWQK